MFNWELVTVSLTGGRNSVKSWSTETVDRAALKKISNLHAVDGKVSLIYLNCSGAKDLLCFVTGKRAALAAIGYPKGNWELI